MAMRMLLVRHANLLDPVQGRLLAEHELLIEGGVVKEVSGRPINVRDADVIDAGGRTVMPGMVDCHVHVTFSHVNLRVMEDLAQPTIVLRSLPILRGMLRRGFTTVRDAGGATHALKQAVDDGMDGTVVGPRLFVSGAPLSPTGGHGDFRPRSDRLAPVSACGCHRIASTRVVDGVDAARLAVREQLQMGADQIKIMSSGGVASPTDPVNALGFSLDETRAIVDEAAARHTYVLAHAYTAEAITRAVQCGVRSIEHGNLVDDAAAALMARHHVYAVPTLVTYEALAGEGQKLGLPPESVEKIDLVREAGLRSLEIFQRAGVRMGLGSDLLGPSHRMQSDELVIRARVQSNADVLRSATVVGAEIVGMAGRLGQLVPGALADLLVVDGNPLEDLSCLTGQGERIAMVMKEGRVCFSELR
jgi:imidazolonepropionase-like amidohydrolase